VSSANSIELAERFAKALDQEDYPTALACLDPDCLYEIRGETLMGAEAIIASYQKNGDSGSDRFDFIRYESGVEPIEGGVRIEFLDHLTLEGRNHTHTCVQELTFNPTGEICGIRHIDLEGEREALKRFEEGL